MLFFYGLIVEAVGEEENTDFSNKVFNTYGLNIEMY